MSLRIKELRKEKGPSLQILGVTDGGMTEEESFHQRFHHLHLGKEWFEPGDDLLEFIAGSTRKWDNKEKSCPVRLDLLKPIHRALRKEAAEHEMSVAALARRIIAEHLGFKDESRSSSKTP